MSAVPRLSITPPDADASCGGPHREPGQVVDAAYLRSGKLRYSAIGQEIVGRNGPYFNNRPLYCNQSTEGAVLVGDRPLVRLVAKPYHFGALAIAIVRDGAVPWIHSWAEIESRYRCGRMMWRCTDPTVPGVVISLTVVPLREVAGFAVCIGVAGARSGDRLVWAFGGAQREDDPRWKWDPVMGGNPDITRSGDPRRPLLWHGFEPEACRANIVKVDGKRFQIAASAGAIPVVVGGLSRAGDMTVGEASAFGDAARLAETEASSLPVAVGTVELTAAHDELFFAAEVRPAGGDPADIQGQDPSQAFAEGLAYLAEVERIRVMSPASWLNAAAAAVCHAVDGNCERNPYVFRHGCMAFNCRFVGWRVICGATALGWHERVRGNAAFTINLQKREDPVRTRAVASAERLLCHEGPGSRFFGRGALDRGFTMYDVQTQFFDQTINDWRWTADAELEKLLRPSLELHLEWMKECFDPDDDGLYESYINTLPTDSVWYNGGGSAEQSAYAFTAHRAAMDLARRAGDHTSAERHRAQVAKIQEAMRGKLWLEGRGHFGLYREQGGQHRVHSDAWVYSVFLPIDAGMTTTEEALQSLFYTEWALERIRLPYGGVLCQPSNWVPWKWSVRDMFGGDMFHLALAYFRTGLGDEGFDLLQGATLESAYASAVPGGFSHIGAATDFGDNVHMFARSVVEGLFGFAPDYPNGVVQVRPAFPSDWPSASIRTPDFSLSFEQDGAIDRYRLTLTKPASLEFRLSVYATDISRVTVDGCPVVWDVAAGYGCTTLFLRAPCANTAEIAIELSARWVKGSPIMVDGRVGDEICLRTPFTEVVEWRDLHQVLDHVRPDAAGICGRLLAKPGHHLILAKGSWGKLERWQVFKLHVTDPAADDRRALQTPLQATASAVWECLDLGALFNGDIRTIFQQRYLSPRPATCSVRLGVDGYSAWTFPYWNLPPPAIDLCHVPDLADGPDRIVTPQGARFNASQHGANIAFTSLWDNWPKLVTVPVNRTAKVIWMLVAGTTFPMQTQIANAELRFYYADGQTETLELIPPVNFWMLSSWGGRDYSYEHDGFCLPKLPPPQVQLGNNCRAMVLSWKLRAGVELEHVTLETLSQDVVIGLMGISLELS